MKEYSILHVLLIKVDYYFTLSIYLYLLLSSICSYTRYDPRQRLINKRQWIVNNQCKIITNKSKGKIIEWMV